MAVMQYQDTLETQKSVAIRVNNVLFATDFSPISELAFPYATAVCRHFASKLHIAHVVSDASIYLMTGGVDYVSVGTLYENAHTEAQEKIQRVASHLDDIPHRTYIRHGHVWENLKGIVAHNDIDLIVVGTHGRNAMGTLLLGSTAEEILRHAPCPVLTVGPKVCGHAKLPEVPPKGRQLAPVQLELENILYATSFTAASLQVAPVAFTMAREFGSRLTLMHVLEDYANLNSRPGPIESGTQQLHALVPEDAGLAYAPEIVMEFGTAWQRIVNAATEREADLIVLGAHPAEGTAHLPWSTVHQVMAHATCPVLSVPECAVVAEREGDNPAH